MNQLAFHLTPYQMIQVEKEGEDTRDWNDEKSVQAFLSGDNMAFAQIVEHYQAYVFAIILKFVDKGDVTDVGQEVFLQVYRSLSQYVPDNLKAWIGKITIRKAIDWKRSHKRITAELSNLDLNSIRDRSVPLPDEFIIREENRQQVQNICRRLPARYGRIIIKYYYEHKSYQQIAREEGMNVRTVESRLYRGRKLIRQQWLVLTRCTFLQDQTSVS